MAALPIEIWDIIARLCTTIRDKHSLVCVVKGLPAVWDQLEFTTEKLYDEQSTVQTFDAGLLTVRMVEIAGGGREFHVLSDARIVSYATHTNAVIGIDDAATLYESGSGGDFKEILTTTMFAGKSVPSWKMVRCEQPLWMSRLMRMGAHAMGKLCRGRKNNTAVNA